MSSMTMSALVGQTSQASMMFCLSIFCGFSRMDERLCSSSSKNSGAIFTQLPLPIQSVRSTLTVIP